MALMPVVYGLTSMIKTVVLGSSGKDEGLQLPRRTQRTTPSFTAGCRDQASAPTEISAIQALRMPLRSTVSRALHARQRIS
jgi:hypothetical protein